MNVFIPALRRKNIDLCEFKASLVYIVGSRITRAVTQRKPVSEKLKKERK